MTITNNRLFILQGELPVEISNLENLRVLRLSYNALVGTFPSELGLLEHLRIVHLHSNRIQGNLTIRNNESPYLSFYRIMHDDGSEVESTELLDLLKDAFDKAKFISDCGSPSAFDEPVDCPNCTMCCELISDLKCAHNESQSHFVTSKVILKRTATPRLRLVCSRSKALGSKTMKDSLGYFTCVLSDYVCSSGLVPQLSTMSNIEVILRLSDSRGRCEC